MLDPHSVLKLLGIDAGWHYPMATDCPLCRARGKLEIRSAQQAHCRSCHFIGDLIELLAAQRKEDVGTTYDFLRALSALDGSEAARITYVGRQACHAKIKKLINEKADYLRQSVPGSVKACLDQLPLRVLSSVVKDMCPHVTVLRQEDFEAYDIPLAKEANDCLRWWGKYTALAIPCWEGIEVRGFWLITTKGSNYLPVTVGSSGGNGFGLVPSFTDDFAVVVQDPIHALTCAAWSLQSTGRMHAFICPQGVRDYAEAFRCNETVFWSPDGDLDHYVRALGTPRSRTLDHRLLPHNPKKELPCEGSWGQFVQQLRGSLPSHNALALYLVDMTADAARPVLANRPLDTNDRARVLSFVSGEDHRHVEALFSTTVREEAITWSGHEIRDTPDGWVVKGRIISAVKLHLDQIRPQGTSGDAVVTGTISYRMPDGERSSFTFKDSLQKITKNTGAWLQTQVLIRAGVYPHVESSWSHKLFEIAQQFHQPTPVMSDQLYGWQDGKLRMPNFYVDRSRIYPMRSLMNGPCVQPPEPLTDGEWLAFKSAPFCRVFLALLGNLLRTWKGLPGVGIMLKNEVHAVTRLAHAFGTNAFMNPTASDLREHTFDPIPVFTQWTDLKLAQMFYEMEGPKNIVLSVDSKTARLSRLHAEWLQLAIHEQIDYPALRVIFLMLPQFIRRDAINVDSEMFYRDIADAVIPDISKACRGHRVQSASIDLDNHNTYRGSTAATRILELVMFGVEKGDIHPSYTDDYVGVSKDEFARLVNNPIIPMPSEAELTMRLKDARFLYADIADEWRIERLTWDLNQSLLSFT